VVLFEGDMVNYMSKVKTYCNEKGQSILVEMPYGDYYTLRSLAQSSDSLSRRIDAVLADLSGSLTPSVASKLFPPGIPAAVPYSVGKTIVEIVETEEGKKESSAAGAGKQAAPVHQKAAPVMDRPAAKAPALAPEAAEASVATAVAEAAPARTVAASEASEVAAVPKLIENFLTAQDPDGGLLEVFRHYYQGIAKRCSGALSATYQEGHICLWNYDEWKMFAYVDVNKGQLRVSVEESLAPEGRKLELWVPPKWMGSNKLARISLDDFSDSTLEILVNAFKAI
jgi:hypothetical protein